MALAQRRKPSVYSAPTQQANKLVALPSPTGGLNVRDALAAMPTNYAVVLENWFPARYGLEVRRGWRKHYYDIPTGDVETLLPYNSPDGTQTLFASCLIAGDARFINVSAGGTYNALDLTAGIYISPRWQFTQIANQTGSYLIAVNGEDTPQFYNGTVWADLTITASATEFPDFDPKTFIHVSQMHRRLWFCERNSTRVWYLPVDEIQGEVKLFDCGEVFPKGGFVQCTISWSVDTGSGMDDQSVFISSRGNVAIFKGFDPDNAPTDFGLVGVYSIGATIGRRCSVKFGSDVAILCEDGVLLLSGLLAQSKILMQPPITEIIQSRLSQDVDVYNDDFGWALFELPRHNQFYINVPRPEEQYQYAMNTILNAWTVFTGQKAYHWALFYDEPFFGSEGFVGQSWIGGVDDPDPVTGVGTSILTRCLQAFSNFGSPRQKMWSMARPVFVADQAPRFSAGFNTDYQIGEDYLPIPPFLDTGLVSLWDVAAWDAEDALWAGELIAWRKWVSLNDLGFTGALFLKTASIVEQTSWIETDYILIEGGAL